MEGSSRVKESRDECALLEIAEERFDQGRQSTFQNQRDDVSPVRID